MTNPTLSRVRFLAVFAGAWLVFPGGTAAQRAGLGTCPTADAGSVVVGFEGVVRDDESEIALPGAIVRLEYEDGDALPALEDVVVTTDENGNYRFCGLQAFRTARVRASYLLHRGKERKIDLERPQDLDLVVDLGDPAFIVFTFADADTGEPVEGATVELSPIPVGGITNEYGRATFRAIPPGNYEMTVRHLAYGEQTEQLSLDQEQFAEIRIELRVQAIALAPLEVQITGRDPWLLDNGFYEREITLGDDGYFGTWEEIQTYTMIPTLFQFKRELSIRFARRQFVLINGRPMNRLGYTSPSELREIPYRRIRGIEAYACSDAPDEIMIQIAHDMPIGDCNLIAIWTR
ncbi:MAG: carboxypeptidase-like regulatory domain-containing protein [Gemmatimonadota bacterium]|nr:carboxypeptidase-like regulatory domain-containing protein [Gemmatimonadota bacterium]